MLTILSPKKQPAPTEPVVRMLTTGSCTRGEKKNPVQQFLVLMAKQKFPMENFILTHNIFVSVEKAKHQVAVCSLLFCDTGLKVTVSSAELLLFRFHNT